MNYFSKIKLLNLLLLTLFIFFYLPELRQLFLNLARNNFFIQFVAVFLGVLGGYLSNRVIEKQSIRRKIIGALEALTAEALANTKALEHIVMGISERPSVKNNPKLSIKDSILTDIDVEKFITRFVGIAVKDDIYHEVIGVLIEMENKRVYERIINLYFNLNRIKSGLMLQTLEGPLPDSQDSLEEVLNIAINQFSTQLLNIKDLHEDLLSFDKDIRQEIRRLTELPIISTH